METASFLVDHQARVLCANAGAEQLLRLDKSVLLHGGQLVLGDRDADAKLQALLSQLRNGGDAALEANGVFFIPAPTAGASLTIKVMPMLPLRGGASMPPHGLALVFFRRHDAQLASAPQLRSMFGLTRKESEICVGLANGQSLEEIAVCLGIGKGTARTHLKNCMTKTGTSRQAHLVSRVLLGSWLPP